MSEVQSGDQVSISIHQQLNSLSHTPFKPYIFRVSDGLRRLNEKAYEPEVLAIGPYHHGKLNLQMMEDNKLRYLQQLLKRRKESSVDRYIVELRKLEERARQCYAESISLNVDQFVKMMLLDGCFIIELFRKFDGQVLIDKDDRIFHLDQITLALQRDLLLFENQVPFFILVELFNMTCNVSSPPEVIILALKFLKPRLGIVPDKPITSNGISVDNVDHLLALVHNKWYSSNEKVPDRNKPELWEFTKCATDLRDAGIKFKIAETPTSMFAIEFKKGILKIPHLQISDNTETMFRNHIAYEQYRPITYARYVTNYALFMDRLINSSKDVEKLCHYGVIENLLGDNEAVSTMFNKLCLNVIISHANQSSYPKVFKEVNNHCRRRRNIWLAKLNRNYFSSPWKIISICAGVLLLQLTIMQTIFSVLSYVEHK